MGLNLYELTGDFISRILFLESVCKAWHTCKVRLMGVRRLSRVELILWVRGVTKPVEKSWQPQDFLPDPTSNGFLE